jgi:hypothetical protein
MKIPPLLACVRLRSITLWLPLVLLWPLALLLIVPVLLLLVIIPLVIPGLSFRELTRLCGGLYLVLCELRGTVVSIDSPSVRLALTLY